MKTMQRTGRSVQCTSELRNAPLRAGVRQQKLSAPRRAQLNKASPLVGNLPFIAAPQQQYVQSALNVRAQAADIPSVIQSKTPLDIVFVSAEVSPWSKTGGLGDVVGGLPIELAKRGHRVISISPRYDQYSDGWDTAVVVNIDGEDVRFFHTEKKGVHRVFVDHPTFLAKVWGKTGSKLYGPRSGADFIDNQGRFALFCKAAIEAVRALPFGPGENCVFVANDWHSALVPVMIKDVYQPRGEFKDAKVAFCIHNIAFQGRFFADAFAQTGLPAHSISKLAFEDGYPKVFNEVTPLDDDEKATDSLAPGPFQKLNWMKAGILTADKVLTVSPNYATEIAQDSAGGVELDTYLRAKGVEGIVNGMDIEEWNPKKDKFLDVKYDKTTVFAGKAAAKEALQSEAGLAVDPDVPVFGFIGRLEEQKGVDILMAALPEVAKKGGVQIVILGTGKAKYEKLVKDLSTKFPGVVKGVVKFSAPMAHLITAGADFMLVPSRFEPCGLIQLHAMQYGTVPLVSSTGGLVDTVKEGETGFHMGAFDTDKLCQEDASAIAATIIRAKEVFPTPAYKTMVKACISQDLSWTKPAKKWEGVLEELVHGTPEGTSKKQEVSTPVQEKVLITSSGAGRL